MKIVLLIGGASPEREVSKESCKSLYQALCNLGHETILVDPALGKNQFNNAEDYFSDNDDSIVSEKNYLNCLNFEDSKSIDLVFNGLHGEFGEDGRIQALLDLAGIPYTGAGVLASSLAMDKEASKIMFKHFGVNTAEWILFVVGKDEVEKTNQKIKESFGYPCIVKPNNQGSTIGLSFCNSSEELDSAIELAGKYSKKIIIEEYINGVEIAVGILGDLELPLCKITPKNLLYDYECKYTDGMSEYEVPAKISEELTAFLKEQARLAYKAVECESYGRVDFLVRRTDNKPFCLEVNTLPGMTSHSLVPKMAKAGGLSFEQMVSFIIEDAMHEARKK